MLDICDMNINPLGKFGIFMNFGSLTIFHTEVFTSPRMLNFHLNKLGNDTTRLVRYVKIANSIVVNYLQRYEL